MIIALRLDQLIILLINFQINEQICALVVPYFFHYEN